jgi:hypothetical protein
MASTIHILSDFMLSLRRNCGEKAAEMEKKEKRIKFHVALVGEKKEVLCESM